MAKNPNWTEKELDILIKNYNHLRMKDLCKLFFNRTPESIKIKANRIGLSRDFYNYWSEEEDSLLLEFYNKASIEEISNKLHRSKQSIKSRATFLKITNPKTKEDVLDFTIIDTEEKAYCLGFIAADGCLSRYKEENNYNLRIKLSIKDESHLINLCNIISPKSKIRYLEQKGLKYIEFYITHPNLKFLCLHNIYPRKTWNPKPPSALKYHLIPHYIRGYFDGDGHIGVINNNYKKLNCTIITKHNPGININPILMFIKDVFIELFYNCSVSLTTNNKVDRLVISGRNAFYFVNWIYKNSNLYLFRKYDIAKNYFMEVSDIENYFNNRRRYDNKTNC